MLATIYYYKKKILNVFDITKLIAFNCFDYALTNVDLNITFPPVMVKNQTLKSELAEKVLTLPF